jgi:undecaprenyl-diphosphatase
VRIERDNEGAAGAVVILSTGTTPKIYCVPNRTISRRSEHSTGETIRITNVIRRFWGARVDRHSAVGRRLTVSVVVLGLAVWAFSGLLEEVLDNAWLVQADRQVYMWSHEHVSTAGLAIFNVITALGSIGAWIVVAAVALWLWHGRHTLLLSAWVGTNVGGGVLQWILKTFIHRARPEYAAVYLHGHSYSFPSGHAMQSTITYVMLVFILSRASRHWHEHRRALLMCASALVLLIGFSRLYLGVHYVSDVVGGFVAGTAWLALTLIVLGIADDRLPRRPQQGA